MKELSNLGKLGLGIAEEGIKGGNHSQGIIILEMLSPTDRNHPEVLKLLARIQQKEKDRRRFKLKEAVGMRTRFPDYLAAKHYAYFCLMQCLQLQK